MRQFRLPRFFGQPLPMTAAVVLALLAAAALAGPALLPFGASQIDLARIQLPPGQQHLVGTDSLGRDVLARAAVGGRVSLAVGATSAAIALLLGLLLGSAAGYFGGCLDAAVMRLVDAFLAIPAFFVLVACQAVLGPGLANVVILISLLSWMMPARVIRSLTLVMCGQEFILAARALGCSDKRILFRHLVTNLLGPSAVLFAPATADALLLESALSFLGLGVPPSVSSWGNMLSDAQAAILSGAWWVPALPGTLILATALAVNLVGDGLQEALGG